MLTGKLISILPPLLSMTGDLYFVKEGYSTPYTTLITIFFIFSVEIR